MATDIAARGIHVDDVGIVIHADPPVEHKAYLHRSGRTARAGADGVVVTLMTDDQVRDVRDLTRLAGVSATTTRVHATHPLLAELAPGPRVPTSPIASRVAESSPRPPAGRSRQQRPAARPAARRSAPGQSDTARSGRRDGAAPAGGESGRPRRNNRPRRAGSTTTHTSSSSGYRSGGAAAFSAGSRVGSRQR